MRRWETLVLLITATVLPIGCSIETSSRPSNADGEAETKPSSARETTPVTRQDTAGLDAIDVESPSADATADDSSVANAADADPTTDSHASSDVIQVQHDEPADESGLVNISFDDIDLPIQEDMVFRPFMMTDRARELDGRRIRIHGYMLPDSKTKGIKEFVLLKNTECKFGPGGAADHLVSVRMVEGADARFRDDPVSAEGILTIEPFTGPDGNTWSIYELACERVERYRPRR